MNWLDVVIILALVAAILLGLRTGIIKAILSLGGLIIGVILARRYYETLSHSLTFITNENAAKIAAFAIILIGVLLIASLLTLLLKWIASVTMLGWINRAGGAIFGLALGTIFCSALLAIWAKYVGVEGAIDNSVLATLLLNHFPMVLALLPEEL